METNPSAYLAGPLGFSESGRRFLLDTLIPLVERSGFLAINPWTLTAENLLESARAMPFGESRRDKWREVNSLIGANNTEALDHAGVVVAVLDGVDVDSGTAAEIGYAAAMGIRVFGYRGDFRLSGDNEGSVVNLQVEYFIHLRGGAIVTELPALARLLTDYRNELKAE